MLGVGCTERCAGRGMYTDDVLDVGCTERCAGRGMYNARVVDSQLMDQIRLI